MGALPLRAGSSGLEGCTMNFDGRVELTARKKYLILLGVALALAAAAYLPVGPRLSTRLKCQRGPGADGTCQVTIRDTGRTVEATFPIYEVTRVGYDYYPYYLTDHPYRRLVISTNEADYMLSLYQYETAYDKIYQKAEEVSAFFRDPTCKSLDLVTIIPLEGPRALAPVGLLLALVALAGLLWSFFPGSQPVTPADTHSSSGTV